MSTMDIGRRPGEEETVPTPSRVFLAAPYSQWMSPAGGLEPVWRTRIDAIRTALLDLDAEVFNAHHNEAWGSDWLDASVCTPVDFTAMRQCDVVCAIVGDPPSGGVAVELGWASALGKPVLLVLSPSASCSPLIIGLGTVTRVDQLDQPSLWHPEDIAEIAERTVKLVGGTETAPTGRPPDDVIERHLAFCSREACRHEAVTG